MVLASARFGKVGRTCRYVPTSQSLSPVRGVCRILSLRSVDRSPELSAMPDVGTYRLGASVAWIPPSAQSKCSRPDTHIFLFLRVFGHSSFIGTVVPVIRSARLGKVGRTCRYVPTSQSLSPVRGVCRILSLHSVDRSPAFSAMLDVGTYRLGASVARIRTSSSSFAFLGILPLSDRHSRHKIRPFGKGRTHLPVRPYIAIIILRSWRLRASFAVSNPCIPLTARRRFPGCRYVPTLQSLFFVMFAPSPAVCCLAFSRIFK